MKRILFALFALATAAALPAQQNQPFYILYSPGCMDQLEYRYTYQNTTIPAYSVRPNASEQYLLTAATPGITSPTLPKGTVRCQDLPLQEGFIEMVNAMNRAVYVVHQTAEGFTMMPVVAAMKVTRQGSLYIFQAPHYAFAIDTLRLASGTNLALPNSPAYVFLNGSKVRACAQEYAFRREPSQQTQERSDFEFIPGIGITNDRTGMNAAQAEANHIRLLSINGIFLDDYLGARCPDQKTRPGATISNWTPPVEYGTPTRPIKEADKEATSISQNATAPTMYSTTGAPPLVACPEMPGQGYHIVQPGDNLNAIARTYDVPVNSLVAWNRLKDANKIEVCQKIWLLKPPANAFAAKGTATQPAMYSTPGKTAAPQKEVAHQGAYWTAETQPDMAPATYSTQQFAAKQGAGTASIHIVQRGETLYNIAQRYNLPEDRLRAYNSFPSQGDVILHPGDRLILCDCKPGETAPQPDGTTPVIYNYNPNSAAPNQQDPKSPYRSSIGIPAPGSTVATPTTTPPGPTQATNNPQSPVTYSTPTTTTPTTANPRSNVFDENQPVATPAGTVTPGTETQNAPATTVPPRPPAYQEYYVRQGDTIGSVAVQFRINAQELALVNGKDINETLIAGQRLLIPKY